MLKDLFLRVVLCAGAALIPAFGASAGAPVERNAHAYHVPICARSVAPGEARCLSHIRVDARGAPLAGKPAGALPSVVPAGYGPADIQDAYTLSGLTVGSPGPVVAIVDGYGYPNAEADLAAYRAQFGLPPCTKANGCLRIVNQNGGKALPRYNAGWALEQALDLDMVSAACPGCRILLVQASSARYSDLAAAVRWAASQANVKAISNSYGGSESSSSSYASSYSRLGIAITASSGDSGFGVMFPASAPGVIAVGGTSLFRNPNVTRGWSETAWSGAGSGCSAVHAKPVWQTDSGCAMRMGTDVSAVADPATGVAVYGPYNGVTGWLVVGGTSASAPIIGAVYALKGGTPNAAQSLWQAADSGSLNDVISGNNGSCTVSYFCNALPGYDGPTGNGTPNGINAF